MIVIRSFLAPLEVHKTSHALVSVPTPRMKHPLPQSNVALLTSILNKSKPPRTCTQTRHTSFYSMMKTWAPGAHTEMQK